MESEWRDRVKAEVARVESAAAAEKGRCAAEAEGALARLREEHSLRVKALEGEALAASERERERGLAWEREKTDMEDRHRREREELMCAASAAARCCSNANRYRIRR